MEKDFISLNSEFSDFQLEQLEERLETDPLIPGGLLDLGSNEAADARCFLMICPKLQSCPELS